MNRRAFLKGAAGIAAGAATVLFAKDHIEAEKPTAIVGEAQTGFVQANTGMAITAVPPSTFTYTSGLVAGKTFTIDCSGDTHTATLPDGSVVGYGSIVVDHDFDVPDRVMSKGRREELELFVANYSALPLSATRTMSGAELEMHAQWIEDDRTLHMDGGANARWTKKTR